MSNKYDVIVIGSGPGGEGAAMKAVKEGKSVAICDDFKQIGGSCTHRGTIPSKALRHASQIISDTDSFKTANYQQVLKSIQPIIDNQYLLRKSFYERNQVNILDGRASFINDHEIEVINDLGNRKKYKADFFVIATGSRPYHPEDIDFTHPRILDSDTVLNLNDHPRTITIYGAGVVGCEYASIFREFKIKVNLINTRNQLLTFLDDEIIDALAYHLRENGVLIRHNEEYEKVVPDDNGITVYLNSNKQIRSDYLLWAQGRTGNSQNMGLENIGIEGNIRGSIEVNENFQTIHPHIYAVGDVIGYPSLASAAYDQGRFASTHIVNGNCEHKLVEYIPTGIYTIPEISSVGLTEKELTEQKVPYEVGHSHFKHLARAQITGRTTGMLKLLFHRETLEILGVHCFGYGASEIVHIGQAILAQDGKANTLMYFINTTFNYPTMAEAYRVAALNGLNRIH
ncbi:MAG: Si-specific NAD(P)(+) transhydrogenase [Ignavibacteriae bacterium]|nr:Si-specific NAD(P)(+) transhydrogenase [Ignavibacteriota bacterium]MCB9206511.1 Si-specific NAD(P)(+) transhydrogenase [Ignavibacteriales bacterium]MCB9211203.1 Si-specific NAD(P)(+) transhydrogenase [Ignavibacteriales bacterium]MCB9219434.1 Si-specific NAD(P)(+) transhydrogenase [Ignavibacteriales bacterium]MCB9259892.1 Si-specific NAD(P)(+) transhydrogenase [Ignavibacteriales bacterium]